MSEGPVLVRGTVDTAETVRVLLIEDDEDFTTLLATWLADNPLVDVDLRHAPDLATAIPLMSEHDPQVIILDLTLPDSAGLRTVRQIVDGSNAAVIVLTGYVDEAIALQSIKLGVQDYLTKRDISSHLLIRALLYALERFRLTQELETARQRERGEREMRRLERLSSSQVSPVTAASYGAGPLSERHPDVAKDVRTEYERILLASLERRAYKAQDELASDIRSLANVLGFVRATPRDLVELHAKSLTAVSANLDRVRADHLGDEARIVVLQLMGFLASYYRARAVGGYRGQSADASAGGPITNESS